MNVGNKVMLALSRKRELFHSEADFQHSFAWELQRQFENAEIRLEVPFRSERGSEYLDVKVILPDRVIAIELKYKTRKLTLERNGEVFDLANHGAQDLGRYDFIKDICRLERFCRDEGSIGYAIILTNDSGYWNPSVRDNPVDLEFRIHGNQVLSGDRAWGSGASDGTKKNRESVLSLAGKYALNWENYSSVDDSGSGNFNYLSLQVSG